VDVEASAFTVRAGVASWDTATWATGGASTLGEPSVWSGGPSPLSVREIDAGWDAVSVPLEPEPLPFAPGLGSIESLFQAPPVLGGIKPSAVSAA
jgi:hypothetical protein